MTYDTFRHKMAGYPLVSRQALKMLAPGDQAFRNQLTRWKKSGKLVNLTKWLFILNEADRKIEPSRLYTACEMYKPSYVSLEYGMSFYGLIPEKVVDLTCVTTRKTRKISNPLGVFSYRHIKTGCFTGYRAEKDEAGLPYYIAEPEKALVDFVYLNLDRFGPEDKNTLRESYRLQNTGPLDGKKLMKYAELFGDKKLAGIIKGVKK